MCLIKEPTALNGGLVYNSDGQKQTIEVTTEQSLKADLDSWAGVKLNQNSVMTSSPGGKPDTPRAIPAGNGP